MSRRSCTSAILNEFPLVPFITPLLGQNNCPAVIYYIQTYQKAETGNWNYQYKPHIQKKDSTSPTKFEYLNTIVLSMDTHHCNGTSKIYICRRSFNRADWQLARLQDSHKTLSKNTKFQPNFSLTLLIMVI